MDDDYCTVWVGGLGNDVEDEIIYELFLQAGPIKSIKRPKEKNGTYKTFAFVCYKHEESVPYSIHLLGGIQIYGRKLKVQNRERENSEHILRKPQKYGIHSLDPEVLETLPFTERNRTTSLMGVSPLISKPANMSPHYGSKHQRAQSSYARYDDPSQYSLGGPIGGHAQREQFDLRTRINTNMNPMGQNYNNQIAQNSINLQQLQQAQAAMNNYNPNMHYNNSYGNHSYGNNSYGNNSYGNNSYGNNYNNHNQQNQNYNQRYNNSRRNEPYRRNR